eukprot:9069782-Pyramimonas_sp.AAC.1
MSTEDSDGAPEGRGIDLDKEPPRIGVDHIEVALFKHEGNAVTNTIRILEGAPEFGPQVPIRPPGTEDRKGPGGPNSRI